MHKTLLFLVACFSLLAAKTTFAAPATPGFETKAKELFMIEASTGTVLLAKNEDAPVSPASLVKLMTMEVIFDAVAKGQTSLDTVYPVSEHAWRTGGAPSRTSTMFAALKSRIRVEDLIRGVVVQQANDACIILAEGLEASEEKFAARMTARARELGMSKSVFVNSTGLPDPRGKVTMRDLVTLARHLHSSYPQFYKYYAEGDFEWNRIRQRNRNPLLALNIGVDGLATGFTEGEGYAIVSSIDRDGKRLFLAMAGLATDKERAEEARRVLEWGMASFESKRIFAAGEMIGAVSVYGGARSAVDLVATTPVDIFVPVSNPERLSARIIYHWPLKAPVEAGYPAGTLKIYSGDRLLREVLLFTAAPVGIGSLASRALDAALELALFWP